MEKHELICIVCPMGCRLEAIKEKEEYKIEGNKCPRGKEYGIKELTNPTRVVTSTVRIKGGMLNRLPVKTNGDIPKEKIFECMKLLDLIEVEAPIKAGDIIVKDLFGTGVDIIAARSM
ncbi:DUF1667 domain-containing protein [Crassaminicella thermophila]|uniref:DUF1667 domain-containing protein n=1 Tax=Crassaminicella thermophila TaxID=2599308 RepID=A0A5C0SB08_CRATE|nr:DUF1667 domain-containing protein [Crassaminicella thermophila]QEK10906.1 DUF1667 domain-containing protein [Crassaminicella thermophila]